jgi:Domain of unknown function (DUF4396)
LAGDEPLIVASTVAPRWLAVIAVGFLATAVVCAVIVLIDTRRYRPRMAVMGWVWPITALYLGPFGLLFYWRVGRRTSPRYVEEHGETEFPHWVRVGVSSTHCGGGCTLGDIVAETLIYVVGISLFGAALFTSYVFDYTFALAFGIAFQFAAIRGMQRLPFGTTLGRAAKADVMSLTAFEVGLFTWMALMFFVFFPGPHLEPDEPTYWFLMQIGMAIGLLTSYPANLLLIRRGIKEAM